MLRRPLREQLAYSADLESCHKEGVLSWTMSRYASNIPAGESSITGLHVQQLARWILWKKPASWTRDV
jgi:hypothetical protein